MYQICLLCAVYYTMKPDVVSEITVLLTLIWNVIAVLAVQLKDIYRDNAKDNSLQEIEP